MAIFRELTVLEGPHTHADHAQGPALGPAIARPIPPSQAAKILAEKKPAWLRIRPPGGEAYTKIKGLLRERNLHTVCEEAHCPNVAECWASGTATFMLGGDTCTRACRFCAVKTARIPPPLDPEEPAKVAESVAALGLHYVVLTSVDRDDLEDGGAGHFAKTISELKRHDPEILVEALVSDFRGDPAAVHTVVESGVDVYAHNIETVKRLQYRVRDPRAGYVQSLAVLRAARDHAKATGRRMYTKSSIMLGLGETDSEIDATLDDLRDYGVDVVTFGQYLRPSLQHLPVEKYVTPEEFARYQGWAEQKGFIYAAAGPMVRSSYRAGELFLQGLLKNGEKTDALKTS